MTLRRSAQVLFAAVAALSAAALIVAGLADVNHRALVESQRSRHESYLLADELRQSSDDLTRFARTYVATGDERYERFYWDVLAIRNGEKPRPDHYERIYWDFVADGRPPAGAGRAVSLQRLMQEAGFSAEEFATLDRAQLNSDQLVNTEVTAMHAVRGEFADATGGFTRRSVPDQALASRLVNDAAYHHQKARIMEPIDQFLAMVDARTAASLDAYTRRSATYWRSIEVLVTGLLVLLAMAYPLVRRRVFEPVTALQVQTAMVAADLGRLAAVARHNAEGQDEQLFTVSSTPIRSTRCDEVGDLSRLHDSMIVQLQQAGGSIASLTADLHAATEAAVRASRAKSAFLATMSHEIRTPIHAVLGYAQLLETDRALGDTQRQNVGVILKSGNHLLTLINNVLEMSKIQSDRAALLADPIDLRALLDGVRQVVAPLARAKGIELEFVLADLPPTIKGDAGKIRQVLINLLNNAVTFTERGRIAVRASSTTAQAGRGVISITVDDTGVGVSAEDLGRIFNAFEHSSSRLPAGGPGLGLSISRELARLMGGDVTASSRSGSGSTFTFTFEAGVLSPPDANQTQTWSEAARDDVTDAARLSDAVSGVPVDLIEQLREAVVQARAARIEQLAAQISTYSEPAAAQIRALAREFLYDALVAALDASVAART